MADYTIAARKNTTDPVEMMDIQRSPASETIGARTLADLFPAYLDDIAHRVAPKTVTNYRHQIGPACAFWHPIRIDTVGQFCNGAMFEHNRSRALAVPDVPVTQRPVPAGVSFAHGQNIGTIGRIGFVEFAN